MDESSRKPRGRLRVALMVAFLVAIASLAASAAFFRFGLLDWGLGGLALFYLGFAAFAITWLWLLARGKLSRVDAIMALALGVIYWSLRYAGELISR